jgi:hypothetical protein
MRSLLRILDSYKRRSSFKRFNQYINEQNINDEQKILLCIIYLSEMKK